MLNTVPVLPLPLLSRITAAVCYTAKLKSEVNRIEYGL